MLMAYQQFCGDSAVTFYTEDIFMQSGSPIEPAFCVIIIGVIQLIAICFASWAIEKSREEDLADGVLFIDDSGQYDDRFDRELLDEKAIEHIQFMPILGVITFCIGFSLGMGPIAWMASSEIFPPEVKSPCIAAAATFNWFLAFLVSRLFFNFPALSVKTPFSTCSVLYPCLVSSLRITCGTCVCIGALGTGTVLGWTSNITDDLKDGKLNDLKMDDDQLGWAGSAMTLGAMVMCFPIGWIADAIGRKITVLLTVIPFTIGWVLIILAKHEAMIYVGRVLTGVAGGSFCVCAPLYTSEISETELRGTLGTFFQLFITIGILYTNVFGYFLGMTVYNVACAAVPIIFAVLFFFQPETPVYYLRKDHPDKAEKSMRKLRGKDYDFSSELKDMQAEIEKEKKMAKFSEAIKTKAAKKATLICFMLMFYQQLSGINAVVFYTKQIFDDAGASLAPHWCTMIIGVVQVVATVFAAWSMDKLGRKMLLCISCGVMGLSCILLGLFFSLKNHKVLDEEGIKGIGFLPILAMVLFIVGFSVGLGPIPWLASSEIFPPEVKAKCSSAAATFNWFLAFCVSRFYLNVANAIGNDITFYIFASICISGIAFVLFVMPETKGKTFAQIVAELEGTAA
nr:unnamed protein product [Callosobruchus analis]